MRDLLWVDYAVFACIILISFAFTVYKNVAESRAKKTKAAYVFASNKSVAVLPMLISIARGFLGVRVFLGYPSELYYRGCALWETIYGVMLAFPIVIYCFIPVYLSLGITSVYQYLDMRFRSKLVRRLASALYTIRSLIMVSIASFTPCIAIKTVIGVPYYISITSMAFVSIVFTCSGGFGSALMGDVVQGVMMLIVCLFVIVQGTVEAGGPARVISIAHEKGRLNFFNFDFDPTKRATTVSSLVGHLFISVSMYACQQNFVQRYASMQSEKNVKRVLFLSIPFTAVLMSLSWIVGMVVFAQYLDCDPMKKQYINDMDELFPFYLEDKFSFAPGMLGVFLAVLFNGALSAVVTNLNSTATVIWEDFLSTLPYFRNMSENNQVRMLKIIGLICGLIIMGLSFAISNLTGIVEISIQVISATGGPLLGIFVLALFFPSVDWKGAIVGMLVGSSVISSLAIGAFLMPTNPADAILETSVSQCTNETFDQNVIMHRISRYAMEERLISPEYDETINSTAVVDVNMFNAEGATESFYRITYLYYSVIGTMVTVITGWAFSFLSGSYAKEYVYRERLIHPLVGKIRPYHNPVNLEIR